MINHQGLHSQQKYHQLRERVSKDIPVYQQHTGQPDVWATLKGKKDDFLIYDRCGRLVYHLGLPYTFLSFPYVEEAIQIAYCESTCGNCSYVTSEIEETCRNISKISDEKLPEAEPASLHHHPGQHEQRHHKHRAHQNRQHNNRVMTHNREGQPGSQEIVDTAPQPAVEGPAEQGKRL